MPQQIIIAEQMRIAALLTDERVDELIVAQGRYQIGDIYIGTVENVLPGIDAAFVNIGESEKNGFIHVSDLGPLRLKKNSAGITELLEPKQKVLVQVIKEPTGNKGPRLTGNLALPGRYLVLQPNGQGVNISRRINSESERNRLRALGVLIKPPGTGLLIRTEGESVSEELLIDDLEKLLKQWDSIQQDYETYAPPTLLNRDQDFIQKILRDHISSEVTRVVVESNSAVERVREFLKRDGRNVSVEFHKEQNNLLQDYKIDFAINNALQPRVELPSGGYIIIEPTEALTVIDVNSGSFTRSANARETVLWTNCEAAKEIARQLKLRNIGGVIIIDFIDMDSRKDQLQLLEQFTAAIQNDSARPQIAQLTELGLLELTRKRQGQNIYELFGKGFSKSTVLENISIIPDKRQNQEITFNNSQDNASILIGNGRKIIEEETNGKEVFNQSLNNDKDSSQFNRIENSQTLSQVVNEDTTSDLQLNRKKTEIITVQIGEEEEEVYSNLGLNPSLLINESTQEDNLIVHIVRPGDDEEEVLKKAKKKNSNSSPKQRRKARSSLKFSNKLDIENQNPSNGNEMLNTSETIEEVEKINTAIATTEDNGQGNKLTSEESDSSDEADDRRRKRRRSSASN